MKSGDAVFLILLKHLSLQPEQIDGNILFMFNPVEENHHTGILTALQKLVDLRDQEGLDYIFAINNDYICPAYTGDTTRYIYTGAMGKILPSFYVLGKETHGGTDKIFGILFMQHRYECHCVSNSWALDMGGRRLACFARFSWHIHMNSLRN